MPKALIVLLAVLSHLAGAAGAGPRVFVLDARFLAEARRRLRAGDKDLAQALKQLRREAEGAMKAGPFAVTFKRDTPPSGDKHDYVSVGPYWWPDPKKPGGKPYIRRDGQVNPQRNTVGDAAALKGMIRSVDTLALGYYFTGHRPYAARAAKLLRVWYLDKATRMNPHLQYGQAIPGRCEGRGIGIVDTAGMYKVVDAAGLLAGSKAWRQADEKALRLWFGRYLKWLRESSHGRRESKTRNNHSTQYDVQVACYALYSGRPDIARDVLAKAGPGRIDKQVQPDGRQPHELARTKSWGYSAYNLRHLFNLARLGEHVGVNLWNYPTRNAPRIRAALDFLLPFAAGGKKWPYRQITKFDPGPLVPLLRVAAVKYPTRGYDAAGRKLARLARSDRSRLLCPPRGAAKR